MKEKNRGVVGVIADIYMGVIQNFLNFSVNLCCIVINRIIFNLIGFHLEQIKEKNDKYTISFSGIILTDIFHPTPKQLHLCALYVVLNAVEKIT